MLFGGKQTVRRDIIEILGREFPLSIKEIKQRLERGSYQAVHKEVLKLVDEEVVDREGHNYLLNGKWVQNCSKKFKEIERTYCGSHQHPRLLTKKAMKNPCMIQFETLEDMDNYLIELLSHANNLSEIPVFVQSLHRRLPLLYGSKYGTVLRKLKMVITYGSATALDRLATRIERGWGCQVRYRQNAGKDWEVIVIGDLVLQCYIKEAVSREIHRIFIVANELGTTNLEELHSISLIKSQHTVLIQNNPALARQLRTEPNEARITLHDF